MPTYGESLLSVNSVVRAIESEINAKPNRKMHPNNNLGPDPILSGLV